MAKPSNYRVSQKRQGLITGTTRPSEALDRQVTRCIPIWQAEKAPEHPCLLPANSLDVLS